VVTTPLNKLHAVTSLAVHELTDDEGVIRFDEARGIFEYFFEELPAREKLHAQFTKKLSEIAKPADAKDVK
jgi:hypothetical protein